MSLFGRSQRSPEGEVLENVVGSSSSFHGTVRSDGGLRVSGAFEGAIEVAGNVVVGREGRVIGNIAARNVTVGGVVRGDIDASGQLQILSTGQVFGDITVGSVMIDEGGAFQGASRMRGLDQPALAPPPADDRRTLFAADPAGGRAPQTLEGTARLAGDAAEAEAGVARDTAGAPGPSRAGEADRSGPGSEKPARQPATATPERKPPAAVQAVREPAVETPPRAAGKEFPDTKLGAETARAEATAPPSGTRPSADGEGAASTSAKPEPSSAAAGAGPAAPGAASGAGAAVPAAAGSASDAVAVSDDFDLDFDELDIEPVIPDVVSKETESTAKPESGPKSQPSRRRSRSGR
jgi:cytoskeletal protein CcmA (bactofilin family)